MKTNKLFGALVFAGLLACCGSLLADPLNNWHWRNPLPNGNPQFGAQQLNAIIFTNGTFFGVGNAGVVATSIDTTNWTQTISATSNQLNGIVYADGKFVAVGVNGAVETSSDGTNWVLQNSGTASSLYGITYAKGKFVAVGGAALSSSDGVNWSPTVPGFPGANQVAGNSAGFVAVNGSSQCFFSADGLSWKTNQLTVPVAGYGGNPLEAQIVTTTGGTFLVGSFIFSTSEGASMFMFSSSDGVHWTTNALGSVITLSSGFGYSYFMTGNNQVIAAGQSGGHPFFQFSPDGVNWTSTNINVSFIYNNAGTYGNGSYVVVGPGGTFVSPDVVNWSKQQFTPPSVAGPISAFNSIAYSNGTYVVASSSSFAVSTNDVSYIVASNTPSLSSVVSFGTNFVAVGSSGQIYTSTNGFSWTQRNSGTANNLHGVAAGNNLLVAVGDNGTVQTSPTGVTWTTRTSGTSLALYSVVYSNGLYVAVGQEGTVVTSLDSFSWTVQDSTVLNDLLSVTYGSAGFLAVGVNSTMVTSPDGINWTQQNPGAFGPFESATFGNGYYLVTGTNGLALTSPDGLNWTSRNVGATGGQTFYGSGFLNGRFDVVGTSGTILESDPVAPLFDLQIKSVPPHDVITAFATPGSAFRILSTSNLVTGPWTTAASFNNAAAITCWTNSSPTKFSFYRLISP